MKLEAAVGRGYLRHDWRRKTGTGPESAAGFGPLLRWPGTRRPIGAG